MRLEAVCLLFTDLDPVELADWVAQGWVRAEPDGDALVFQAIDVARVRLVHDLRRAMAVDAETVGLVLALLDQVYALRGRLGALSAALADQPEMVRAAVLDAMARRGG
ncbi:MAG: hypothetical protein BGP12_02305 [Rhodospirillales bacterium 70-18]|nr:MAG: hypothetical protein BGP12_02305 [Rhodospirillales bacterium 70-18]